MPYSVQHLIEGRPSPITASREDKVRAVLSRMIERDFSQLPVVDADGHPVGMVTYESVIRGIQNFKVQIDNLSVREVMINAHKVDVNVFAEETDPRESRYAPLADWLNSLPGTKDQVSLSFKEVEEIIDGSLPASARTHRSWWANDSHSHSHSRIWLEVGWRRTRLNMSQEQVAFARIREREKAYIEFFSGLLNKLRNKGDFPERGVSPDGASWIPWQLVSIPGNIVGYFNFSFSRDHQFRVELYLDTGEQETTKQIFDYIRAQQAKLESELGEISWERIDNKRASRIAIYHPGQIMDKPERLEQLQNWGADRMVAFYKALEPLVLQAAQEVLKV